MEKILFLAILLFLPLLQAELKCEHIYSVKTQFFLNSHIKKIKMNQFLENKSVSSFIDNLDPGKMYLTQVEARKLKKMMKGIFNETRKGKCKVIISVYKQFLKYFDKRIEFIRRTLKSPQFKLIAETSIKTKKNKKRSLTLKDSLKNQEKHLQIQVARWKDKEMSFQKAKTLVLKFYQRFYARLQSRTDEQIFSEYLKAFARSLDPHSNYFSREEWNDFQIGLKLSFEGIGAHLRFDELDGLTTVHDLVEGGAAERGGKLKREDKIVAVAQGTKGRSEIPKDKLKFEDVVGLDISKVVKKIKGPRGTSVYLKVLRKVKKKEKKVFVKIVRDKIKLESKRASISYVESYIKGKPKKIGIIRLSSFYADRKGFASSEDVKNLLIEAKKKSVSGIVLDLSKNSGGVLNEAVKISGLFFKSGNVVKQSQKNHPPVLLRDKDGKTYFKGPLVVLIDRESASASEIVAGALKDYKRAIVVGGAHTFGKGTVQMVNIIPHPSPLKTKDVLGATKTTVGLFFIPGGFSTQHIGVSSDITFPSAYDYVEAFLEKDQPNALPPEKMVTFLSEEAYSGGWKKVTTKLKKFLAFKSKKRIKKNKDFEKIIAEGKEYKQKDNQYLSVKEVLDSSDERLKQKKKLEANKKLTKAQKKASQKKDYLNSPYIKEAVNILSDMLKYYDKNTALSSST